MRHAYLRAGSFHVTVVVQDAAGNTAQRTFVVAAAPLARPSRPAARRRHAGLRVLIACMPSNPSVTGTVTARMPGAKPVPFRCSVPGRGSALVPGKAHARQARRRARDGPRPRRPAAPAGLDAAGRLRRRRPYSGSWSAISVSVAGVLGESRARATTASGVALPLRNVVEVERRPGPLEVSVSGEGAGTLPSDATNLVVRSFAQVWDGPLDGLAFHMRNAVPLQSGTGSSSAAIVAGLAAALALQGRPLRRRRADRAGGAARGPPRQRRRGDRRRVHARARRRAAAVAPHRAAGRARVRARGAGSRARHDRVAQVAARRRCRAPTPSTACSAPRCSCTRSPRASSTRSRARSRIACTSPTAPH